MTLATGVWQQKLGNLLDDLKVFTDAQGNIIFAVNQVDEVGQSAVLLSAYKISNIDADASPNYYGFETAGGAWYILKETLSAGADVYEYAKGSSDLATNWGNRTTSLVYGTFADTF